MSSDQLQIGVMGVVLDRKMFDDNNNTDNYCIDENDRLFFNYDGTLVYILIEDQSDDFFLCKFIDLDNNIKLKNEFQLKLLNSGIILDTINYKIKFFVNSWYDGSDNPINIMSVKDFVNL